jgi:ADP-ribosylglycohydrolase
MRVSPIGFAFNSVDEVMRQSRKSAEATHNHPEGVRGAQAVAVAILLARQGYEKSDIRKHLERVFGYRLSEKLDDIRNDYSFDVSCQGSVPQSIIAFLESNDYEDAVRNAVSLGGDADTMACIAGGIAEAFYKSVPEQIRTKVMEFLDARLQHIVAVFSAKYGTLG